MSTSQLSLASNASSKILSDDSIMILKLRNDDSPIMNGFRSISNTSYMSEASLESQETVEIPEYLESLETFRFLEFNEATAQALWHLYCEMLRDDPDRCDLLKTAKRHITSTPGDAGQGDDWVGHMDRVGLTKSYQARIMAPMAQEMREVASANEWAIQMVTMRFEFLQSLDDIIKTPSRGVERPVRRITPSGDLGKIAEEGPEIPERGSSKGKLPPMKNFQSGPSTAAKPPPPEQVEGCRMFYNGGALARLQNVFQPDGTLHFGKLRSTPPTDFSWQTGGLYLTKQVEVAWKYAQWAARIVDGAVVPIGILQVAIPIPLLASSYELFGNDWRRCVWAARYQERPPPKDMAYLNEFQWIVGPLCKQSQHNIAKMRDESELEMWRLDSGQVAHQLYTSTPQMFELLDEHCREKVWVYSIALRSSK
ncbi:hypothetical protein MMC07_001584 [Pseudocyphellaria aurata]|nr:hypothetical protein [Pseudocyphellaria aurata]